jgi:hypothetical protein
VTERNKGEWKESGSQLGEEVAGSGEDFLFGFRVVFCGIFSRVLLHFVGS